MGNTFEGWTQIMVFSMLFVIVLSVVIVPQMNNLHGGNNSVEGLNTEDLSTSFQNSQERINQKLKGGDVSFLSTVGLTISTSADILLSFLSLFMSFIGGGWIMTIFGYLPGAPDQLAWVFRGLWIISLGMVILKLLFRQKV